MGKGHQMRVLNRDIKNSFPEGHIGDCPLDCKSPEKKSELFVLEVKRNDPGSELSPDGDGEPLIFSCQGLPEQINGDGTLPVDEVSKKRLSFHSRELRGPAVEEIPSDIKELNGRNEIGVDEGSEVGGCQGLFSIHAVDFVGNPEEVIRHRILQAAKEIGTGGGDLKAPGIILQNLKGRENLLDVFFIMLKEEDAFSL
jgi:hypothetical protein